MRRVSAVIIAQNEAERLEACVRSCQPFADEIVVVDGGSEDGTQELARSLGCSLHENPWPGYARQRNFGAGRAVHDWIFWIDADEVAGEDLAQPILAWKQGSGGPSSYSVRRIGDFMGRWLHGSSERLVRLYDRRECEIPIVSVHEEVESGGKAGEMPGRLWHFGFRSISDHIVRFDRYTTLEAEKARAGGRRFSLLRLLWRPPARLFKKLFLERLYKEGVAGFTVCVLWVQYEIMRELKLREIEWQAEGAPRSPIG